MADLPRVKVHEDGRMAVSNVASTMTPNGARYFAAVLLSAAAWAERQAEAEDGLGEGAQCGCYSLADHELRVYQGEGGCLGDPSSAPYQHSSGQPCHGCQICLDDGEASDG